MYQTELDNQIRIVVVAVALLLVNKPSLLPSFLTYYCSFPNYNSHLH